MSRTGYSLLELMVCLSLAALTFALSGPALLAARDDALAAGAADYVVSELHGARMEALKRRASVAVRFEAAGEDFQMAVYVDGNGNGVRSADIARGEDTLIRTRWVLQEQFAGVRFGFEAGVPDADGGDTSSNTDPIRVGVSRMLSFSPNGTSSSGTVYLHGRGPHQLAVRVLGGTGRIRSLQYEFGARRWVPR
jgi:Tfp pilus assembly protein FimT